MHRIRFFFGFSRYPIAPEAPCIEPFDIVHVHGVDASRDFLAATRLLHRKPLVLSTHGGFFHTKFAGFLKPVFFHTVTRASLRQYRRVFACSANDEAIFRRWQSAVRAEFNGVDTSKFADAASRKFVPTLVDFGRFSSNKGLDRLIDAFEVLRDEVPRARLHIMGGDWDELAARPKRTHRRGTPRHCDHGS